MSTIPTTVISDIIATWNSAAIEHAIKMNVTDVASDPASMLLQLQLNSVDRFVVEKDGTLTTAVPVPIASGGTSGATAVAAFDALSPSSTQGDIIVNDGANDVALPIGANNFVLTSDGTDAAWAAATGGAVPGGVDTQMQYNNSGVFGGSDLLFTANLLEQRNGVNAQTSRIFNTFTDASNYERGKVGWNTNVLEIGAEAAGTGTLRDVNLVGNRFGINIAAPDGTFHIFSGSAGAVTPSSQQNDLVVENSGDAGMTILSPDANVSSIVFGSPGGTGDEGARIRWSNTANLLQFGTTETGAEISFVTGFLAEAMRIDGSGNVGIGITPIAGVKLLFPIENDAVTPTMAFGTGGLGIYALNTDTLQIASNGSARWVFNNNTFRSFLSSGPSLQNITASGTVPTLRPNQGDSDSGIGSAGADILNMIAGGVSGIQLTENVGVLQTLQTNGGLTADVSSVQGGLPLTSSYNVLTTVANVGDAATLPLAVAGEEVYISNRGANSADIFPDVGDDAGAGVNLAVALAAGANITYFADDGTNWSTKT